MSGVGSKAAEAARWSLVTQVVAKLISPVTTLVLAHVLAPEAFGVVATVTMVVSFAEMFSDAGFQKYLVQHEFDSGERLRLCSDVAFWTNLAVSLLIWALVAIFRDPLAAAVGNPGLGLPIAVACASLPLVSLSSVQVARYQRDLDFKGLFSARVGSALVVFAAAVPLALLGAGYWSLIASTVASNLFLAVWLTARSAWRPGARYSWAALAGMFSFSAWTLLEAFTIWLTSWAGTFVLGAAMDAHYLGLYKTAVSLTSSITSLASSAVNPVVFSTLSRLQGDRARFDSALFRVQGYLALVLVPMALAMLVFRGPLVEVLLGPQWSDAVLFFGLYSASSAVVVVFAHTLSEAYRSLGRPRLSTLVQALYLAALVPTLWLSAGAGWGVFSVAVPAVRLVVFTGAHFAVSRACLGLSPWAMVRPQLPVYAASAAVAAACALALPLFMGAPAAALLLLLPAAYAYLLLAAALPGVRPLLSDLSSRMGAARLLDRVLPRRLRMGGWSEKKPRGMSGR